jgi:hypothetical protein
MNSLQNVKIVTAVENAASTTITGSVDTRGFSYAMVVLASTTAGTISTVASNTKIEQSDDNSTWEAMPGLVTGTDFTPSTGSIAVTQPKIVLGFSLKGRKRYLKFTAGAVSSRHTLTFMLTNPNDGVSSATESGVTNFFML